MFVCRTTTVSFSPNVLAKGFLTENLGDTFLINTRMEPPSAPKKNLENINLTGGLVFKFPVLFTALLDLSWASLNDVVKSFLSKLANANHAV